MTPIIRRELLDDAKAAGTNPYAFGPAARAVNARLEERMREAAADLNFEEAARLRDEVKRLRATELAVVDDPTIKQRGVAARGGAYTGAKKYGAAANLPADAGKGGRGGMASRARKPTLDEMGPGTESIPSRIHKPDLDEMGIATWHEVKPVGRGKPRKPSSDRSSREASSSGESDGRRGEAPSASKIFQPTSSREAGPEFGPAPRSTGGAPGRRGGWKKR